ncbi:hypothetical protein [Aliarcobacter butzleri]|uniref:hypothetical protein n=1 Tax=Aliarcobacter butzleri TaxID=28197 RepID=UPI000DB6479E|nr:hypothetical protein [Aliarcobacter butzleri]MCG3690628.1 hypothetical protein [Aliarcobacter butzleri]MCT7567626.1 hypothetical protein [Aliarcobacter butzleri]MDN5068542.1 hypothetical protein [Aliarcobacter butzleri]PZP12448.1 MAG: hypothetical protein DI602_09225 [Aliarcobacter butzleri]
MISEFSTTDYKVEFKSVTRSKAKWGEQFMINNLYLLIKFGEQQYMQDLYENGTLFFRKVKKFRNDDNIQREDKNEGISHSLQLSRFAMYVNGKKFSLSDNGYVSIDHYPNIDFLSYSMYALTTEHFKVKDGIYIDTRNFEFGDTCVIIKDINEFYKRIQKYCNDTKIYAKAKPIEYVNPFKYDDKMDLFKKYNTHEHQSEWRILLHDPNNEHDCFKIKLGSLKDIADIMPSKKINEAIKFVI